MVVPVVTPWMKEFCNSIRFGINSSQVRSLVKITIDARERQVIKVITAAMYLWDNVLNVKYG
jgi:hypothetical protein